MCGITGFYQSNPSAGDATQILTAMTAQLTHRGPDDSGIWFDSKTGIALGHRRLSILDLSAHGRQPMLSQNERFVLVYNGEIYNFLTLKKQLEAKQYCFKSHSDTEVILTLMMEYGLEQALPLLSGMFAFALWDKQNQTLHLARDRVGEKPLYYGLVNGAFVFGSELKAMRNYPGFSNAIDRGSLTLFLRYGYIPAPHSIYEGIHKLAPGTYLTVSQSAFQKLPEPTTYWSAIRAAEKGIASPHPINDAEAISATHDFLNLSVKNRMISDVPIGALLSGGIDSSLITALMQANSATPIKTFTIGFHEKTYNEAHYAKAVASHLGTYHTELYIEETEALDVIPKLPIIYDEPFADSSAIPTYLVSLLTKQQVSVCLSGDGGDELFGGYNRYLLAKTLWKKIALCPYPIRIVMQKVLLSASPTRWQQLLYFLRFPMIGDKLHKLAGGLTAQSPELLYHFLISQWHNADELVTEQNLGITPRHIRLHPQNSMTFIEKMMLTDTLSYLPDDILVKLDRATMAAGLESRAPFLDHEVLEFAWGLPMHLKVRNHTTKWVLREILSQYVPKPLFERPKMGFGIPLNSWLRGPLREWAEHLLNKKVMEAQGFLRPEPILQKWHEHVSGKRNWQYPLWTVLMFQAWIETQRI